jgi:hypothetical protein
LGMIRGGAFGEDQTNAAFGTPAIVGGDILARHAIGRMIAGHRGHHDAIGE